MQQLKHREWERKSASMSHFRADGIMRSGQEPQTCGSQFSTMVQTQRDNWQDSSLSIWDAPPANVPPVCPPTPQHIPPQTHLKQHTVCWLAISAGPLAWPCILGFPIVSPGVPLAPMPPPPQPPRTGQVKLAHFLGGRDRAQVCSCSVMALQNGLIAA